MRNQDSLDLLGRQDRVLEQLFEAWNRDDPEGRDRRQKINANWEQGTVAKLILEQGALRIAALEDVVRTLRLCHQQELAKDLGENLPASKLCLDRIDECSRGVTALDLRYSSTLKESIEKLRNLWIQEMRRASAAVPELAQTLGAERKRLHSALYIRAHAPLHPSVHHRWYDKIPVMVRIHALYDLLRSFPDAESGNWADTTFSKRINEGGRIDV